MRVPSNQLFVHHDLNHLSEHKNAKISKLRADLGKIRIRGCKNTKASAKAKKNETKKLPNFNGIDFGALERHLRDTRHKHSLATDPLAAQPHINRLMRAVLLNWLADVCSMFKCKPRTIFLCGSILDRYLSAQQVQKSELQLLGVACLYIASKFEDIAALKATSLCALCDSLYSPTQVHGMEARVLAALQFELVHVSALDVLQLQLARLGVHDARVDALGTCVLHAYLLHGTLSVLDSTKMADFVCALAHRAFAIQALAHVSASVGAAEAGELSAGVRKMIDVARKHGFDGLSVPASELKLSSLLAAKEAN